jgi:acyl-CoA synthetase (AMP-forming)/AMP-acid ligase II
MWRCAEIRYLPDIPRYWSQKRSDKVALIEGSAQRTYAQLNERSSAIANRLLETGAKHGDPIGYIGKNSIEVFEIWFAASKIGCTFAPFNWRLAAAELVAILDDARPPIVFVGAEIAGTMRQVRERTGTKFEIVEFQPSTVPDGGLAAWAKGASTVDPGVKIRGDDIALLSYTSGTTGLPKGVTARHEAFQYSFLCGTLEPALTRYDDDILLMSMPNFHLGGSWVSIAAMISGRFARSSISVHRSGNSFSRMQSKNSSASSASRTAPRKVTSTPSFVMTIIYRRMRPGSRPAAGRCRWSI